MSSGVSVDERRLLSEFVLLDYDLHSFDARAVAGFDLTSIKVHLCDPAADIVIA